MENILMRIAREANRTGDAKTLFHALDLLRTPDADCDRPG